MIGILRNDRAEKRANEEKKINEKRMRKIGGFNTK